MYLVSHESKWFEKGGLLVLLKTLRDFPYPSLAECRNFLPPGSVRERRGREFIFFDICRKQNDCAAVQIGDAFVE